MSLWVKICANTSLDDARVAAEAGADAVGFVFAPSPRQVTITEAAAITAGLPEAIEKIGVFVDASLVEILEAVQKAGLTGAQLHFDAPRTFTASLRQALGKERKILRVIHFDHFDPGTVLDYEEKLGDPSVDAVLVDARTRTAVGGTGKTFDWRSASETLLRAARQRGTRLIVAGGLYPGNVAAAIQALAPWGVDVASGVEAAPGKKNPAEVRAFLAAAHS
jgi:phosphoribosylanthranilate isomerase